MLNLILIDVKYSQLAVFNFEIGSNHQNPPSKIFEFPPPLTAIWKTLTYGRKCKRCWT